MPMVFTAIITVYGSFLKIFDPHPSIGYWANHFLYRDALARGERVILEIDLQGARQVRAKLPQARLVFIAPPNWDELVARLVGRGTETAEQRQRRLATAKELRNELRNALPGVAPVQPATFELPTAMTTSEEIRAGWGALELGLLEGLGRLVAAGGPGRERWLELMVGAADSVGAMGRPLPHWPGWV